VLVPNWCEVTYINHIGSDPGSSDLPSLSRVMRGFTVPAADDFLPEVEGAQIGLTFEIPGETSVRGRLSVSMLSAVHNETGQPMWAMTLTARILAADGGIDAALRALDDGHEWVVNGFENLTSEEMHARWHTVGGPK